MVKHHVRPYEAKDLEWALCELEKFSAHYGTKYKIFPGREIAKGILEFVAENHVFLVSEAPSGFKSGLIAGILTQHFINPEITILSEIFWWVTPEYRLSRAGSALLDAFTEIGKQKATWTVMTSESRHPVSEKSLSDRGYAEYERNYLMES